MRARLSSCWLPQPLLVFRSSSGELKPQTGSMLICIFRLYFHGLELHSCILEQAMFRTKAVMCNCLHLPEVRTSEIPVPFAISITFIADGNQSKAVLMLLCLRTPPVTL